MDVVTTYLYKNLDKDTIWKSLKDSFCLKQNQIDIGTSILLSYINPDKSLGLIFGCLRQHTSESMYHILQDYFNPYNDLYSLT